MEKVDTGNTTHRNMLLEWCMEKSMSAVSIAKIVEPMAGKSNEEKEQIAKQLLEELESGKIKPDVPHDRSKYAPFL